MEGFFKEDLLERLARLDEDADLLFDDDRRFKLVIVGQRRVCSIRWYTRPFATPRAMLRWLWSG